MAYGIDQYHTGNTAKVSAFSIDFTLFNHCRLKPLRLAIVATTNPPESAPITIKLYSLILRI